ncbi:MAG: citrate lyase acyl carrier protein [Eubacteriales bacterium]|nr:citrate lyase acyl carrier protein [Eubacteriales bacterium]
MSYEIRQSAAAGTMESSDVLVTVTPGDALTIEIESPVKNQYGEAIERVVRETLSDLGVTKGLIKVMDKGAIDCVIAARVETAIKRAGGN